MNCWYDDPKYTEDKVREILELPKKHIPLNIIFMGHPAEEPEARDQYDESRVHFI